MKYLNSIISTFCFVSLFQVVVTHAEVMSFTVAGKIRSFDQKAVICEVDGHLIQVNRSLILKKKFKTGDVVLIEIPGADLGTLRSPATKPSKSSDK